MLENDAGDLVFESSQILPYKRTKKTQIAKQQPMDNTNNIPGW